MNTDAEAALFGFSVFGYFIGIPITWGYLYTVTGADPHYALGVLVGSIGWPLYLLGRVGAWIAS